MSRGNPVKIMMLMDSLTKGGKERRLIELLKGLQSHSEIQCELTVFSKKIYYDEVVDLGIPIHILERNPDKDPRIFHRLYFMMRKFRPDVIHSWGSMTTVYAIPAAKILGIKLLNAMITDAPDHLSWGGPERIRSALTFPFSDVILANSLAGLKAYKTPIKKSRCIYNGFNFARISELQLPSQIRAQFKIKTRFVVGMVGAFEDRKDYLLFIKTAIEILRSRMDVTFLAVGDGKNLAACQDLVPDAMQNGIQFTGVQDNVESIINIFDIGVLISNQAVHGEGISNAIMEYMALGKPVIATFGGGTPEIVVEGKTGMMVKEATPKIWAAKIKMLLDDGSKRTQMGEAGRVRVQDYFNQDDMTQSYLDLYSEMIGKIKTQSAKYV